MKSILWALFILFCITGCSSNLSNEEIVSQSKFCEENGMKSVAVFNGFTYKITDIICYPKES